MNPVLQARMARQARDIGTRIVIEGEQMHIQRTQDCTPIADRAYSMHKEGLHGSSDLKLAASIPNVIIEKYMNDHGISYAEFIGNQEHMRRICNDPDNKMFRIWPGRL